MTRKRDRQLKTDKGQTTEQLAASGYICDDPGGTECLPGLYHMRKGTSVKTQCTSCQRWFDEVVTVYIDTHVCWHCRRGD